MSAKFKFDSKKFEKSIKKQTASVLNKHTYEITCPHCQSKITVPTGKSLCPICKNEIDLSLDIKF